MAFFDEEIEKLSKRNPPKSLQDCLQPDTVSREIKMKKICVLLSGLTIALLLTACGQSEAAAAVDQKISEIGEVTIESQDEISDIEDDYAALDDKDKDSLKNYAELQKARDTVNNLLAEDTEQSINDIGEVDSQSENNILTARNKYDSLTGAQKSLVTNLQVLIDAETKYDAIIAQEVQHVEQLINNIGAVTLSSECENAIVAAENAYKSLPASHRADVTNYNQLVNARKTFDNTPPVQINSYRLSRNIIGQPEMRIGVTNISDKIVKSYAIALFAYDNDGLPVQIYFNDFYQRLRSNTPLSAGESSGTSAGYWQLYGEYSEMQQIVAYVDEVEFYDGTVWNNPNSDSLFARYNENLLSAGDENILEK